MPEVGRGLARRCRGCRGSSALVTLATDPVAAVAAVAAVGAVGGWAEGEVRAGGVQRSVPEAEHA